MPLAFGESIGPYKILVPIGAGGMGEVYRAHDAKLKRDVALKVLPEAFARDPERMARFEREAQLLASLNHANIAHLYGLEGPALVMELVEGESPHGPMPFDEAWKIASQIADALEYAHERGVIHRDLKPANVKVTPEGTVKLLDFGLAKAYSNQKEASASAENSPTLTFGATEVGMILGTAAYMAPEQARGKAVDKRADIWSFGVVLYELLTGQRPFHGEDAGDILASVIKEQPNFDKVPAKARLLIENCLEKDPKLRLRDIGDAGRFLSRERQPAETVAIPADSRSRFRWLSWGVAALLLFAFTALGFVHFRETPPAEPSLQYQISPPGNTPTEFLTLSPDGRTLAFVTGNGGPVQIWVRAMDALEAKPLAGTHGATYPFWSPDGAYVGYFTDGKLKKIAIAGGPPQTLCDAATGRGGTWNRDGVILFSPGPASVIFRVPAGGGTPVPVTKLAGTSGDGNRFPVFLPDGVHFIYNAGSDKPDAAGVFVGSLNGAAETRILPDITNVLYAPPAAAGGTAHILFKHEGTLMAQPFDAKGLKTTGDPFPVAQQVSDAGNSGFGAFSVSENGLLTYRSGGVDVNRELIWIDRSGKRLGVIGKPGAFLGLALSPDDRTLAVEIGNSFQSDIWLEDLARGVLSRFTFRAGSNRNPVWSPDGSRVIFSLLLPGTYSADIFEKPTGGNGQEELLLHSGINGFAQDWSPDGKWIVYAQTSQKTAIDLWLFPRDGDRKPVAYWQTPFDETNARFSPDGKWMAYQSNESGRTEIYVQAVPLSGAKYQISSSGGSAPRWRRDGKELFFISADQKLMAVPVKLGATVEAGTPQFLFPVYPLPGVAARANYATSRDGQRFLVNVPAGGEAASAVQPITVVTNWQAATKK